VVHHPSKGEVVLLIYLMALLLAPAATITTVVLAKKLHAERQVFNNRLKREQETSTRLLEANNVLSEENHKVLTDNVDAETLSNHLSSGHSLPYQTVVNAIQAHPEVVEAHFPPILKTMIREGKLCNYVNMDALLLQHAWVHEWSRVGVRVVKVHHGKTEKRYRLLFQLCERCRVEHRYFANCDDQEVEKKHAGFFLHGDKVPLMSCKDTFRTMKCAGGGGHITTIRSYRESALELARRF
jgi:hypothetical protein